MFLFWILQQLKDLVTWCRNLFAKPAMNRYGWKRGLPHDHGKHYTVADRTAPLPAMTDMRASMPPVYDQGQLGSCTANATGGSVQYEQIHHGMANFAISRLFQYYNTRSLEGSTGYDSGGTIADAVKAVATWGYCPETSWGYVVSRFKQKPPASCYTAAKANELAKVDYAQVAQNAYDIKSALAAGNPIIIGFTVYESFESQAVAKTGMMPMRMGPIITPLAPQTMIPPTRAKNKTKSGISTRLPMR